MKILFTSVGRRVELVQAFKAAANKLNMDLQIYGADISETAPARFFCDFSVDVPRITDADYIPFLIDFCKENDIDAVIPTIDTDLQVLAENKEHFGRTEVIISNPDVIKICQNKKCTADFFRDVGLCCPNTVNAIEDYVGDFPAFIKPNNGSSSVFAYKVGNQSELQQYAEQVPNYIIQPFIDGTEYTVDILCDFDGNPVFITPRARVAMRSGEVIKSQILQDEKIIKEMEKLLNVCRFIGPITVQLIREHNSKKDYYIEINPRFGGGAPLSIMAGADSAEALLCLMRGDQLSYKPHSAEDGAFFSRFDQSIRVR